MLDQQVTLLQLQGDGQQEKSVNLADKVLIGEGGNVMTTSVGGLQSAARSLFLQS
uniref:Pentatricopeptide repeat-containing protein n=1 Tax=Solanum tuberosum TaxID=4113 RepID=M1AYP1_SOLTU